VATFVEAPEEIIKDYKCDSDLLGIGIKHQKLASAALSMNFAP
jgi:hypothetical protein